MEEKYKPSRKCECEHVSHFEQMLTGNAEPEIHKYKSEDSVIIAKTSYGDFAICADCLFRHWF